MLSVHPGRYGLILALTLCFWAVAVQARVIHYRYHYVSLYQLELPAEFTSFALAAMTAR